MFFNSGHRVGIRRSWLVENAHVSLELFGLDLISESRPGHLLQLMNRQSVLFAALEAVAALTPRSSWETAASMSPKLVALHQGAAGAGNEGGPVPRLGHPNGLKQHEMIQAGIPCSDSGGSLSEV